MVKVNKILVTGGAGYVGSVLVPQLLNEGYAVNVLDLFLYGEDVFDACKDNPKLTTIKGDLRDRATVEKAIEGCDGVIHLACISNDPSFELNPDLGKTINYDAFLILLDLAQEKDIKRFIYASSSSVYGIKDEPDVTEDLPLDPLTDYSKYKAECEKVLWASEDKGMIKTIVRPSTVCGYSPRLRLDLTVNILTNHAINKGKITVFGGEQKRPNLHIQDMCEAYLFLLKQPAEAIHRKTYNIGYQNYKVKEIADIVKKCVNPSTPIEVTPTDDNRSYHVSSRKIKEELGFEAKHTVEEAVEDLKRAFEDGRVPNPMTDNRYYNIKTMQAVDLK